MIKIVADKNIPFLRGVLEPYAAVRYIPGNAITRKDLRDADALITRTRTSCNASLLQNTNIQIIASATIGYDHIDTEFCSKAGIIWKNAPGSNAHSVLQYVASAFAYLISQHTISIENIVVGIVGVGHVGSLIHTFCKSSGIRCLLNDPPRERQEGKDNFVPIDTILAEADIVSFHAPLNYSGIDATFHMAGQEFFGKLKKSPFIINTSRGGVIDSNALKEALTHKKIKGFILDVWEEEPDIDEELLQRSLLGTPHIAGYSIDGKANATAECVNELSQHFHLDLNNWYPGDLPGMEKSKIYVDCLGRSQQEVMEEVFWTCYPIKKESDRLKAKPGRFEEFRNHYPVRRDFHYYELVLNRPDKMISDHFTALGFKTKLITTDHQ